MKKVILSKETNKISIFKFELLSYDLFKYSFKTLKRKVKFNECALETLNISQEFF